MINPAELHDNPAGQPLAPTDLSHAGFRFVGPAPILRPIEHMHTLTIRELLMKTGDWIRKAVHREGVVVLDRRQPVARIIPYSERFMGLDFSGRTLVKGYDGIKRGAADSAAFISEDRDRG